MTDKWTARAWHEHETGGWPSVVFDTDGNPRAVSEGRLEHSHEGGGVPHTHRLIVEPYEPAA